jgi:hypothetical protein
MYFVNNDNKISKIVWNVDVLVLGDLGGRTGGGEDGN